MEIQPSSLVLDLDQSLQRQALLEAVQLLSSIRRSSSCPVSIRSALASAQLRLVYLAIHLRYPAQEEAQLQSLNRALQLELRPQSAIFQTL